MDVHSNIVHMLLYRICNNIVHMLLHRLCIIIILTRTTIIISVHVKACKGIIFFLQKGNHIQK